MATAKSAFHYVEPTDLAEAMAQIIALRAQIEKAERRGSGFRKYPVVPTNPRSGSKREAARRR